MYRFAGAVGLAWTWLSLVLPAAADPGQPRIDFNRDIRPILSNNCFICHGPDENERQAGLRLDVAADALAELESGARAIVPGDAEQSELIRRVAGEDPGLRMPPAESGKQLKPREIELLRQWIEQGAPLARHWSYEKPVRPPLPEVKQASWPAGAIDHFILHRLERAGLSPSPEADRLALVRRVSLDLTGLPPTLEEVDRFLADPAPDAYERLVDRLLEKQSYGEHWARMWLDLARYADSAGYADDPPRIIWAYRDWVIRALNANVPFDQFTIDQIAGDLLPDATEDQLIATAFHRNTLTNNEGGTNDEEFRNVAVVDRVNTTMAVWMGTTIACAQCHTHKYDPISQHEYFRFFAIFNNTADADRRDESPLLELYTPEQIERRRDLQADAERLQTALAARTPELLESQRKWEARVAAEPDWHAPQPEGLKSREGAEMAVADDGSVRIAAARKTDVNTVELPLAALAVLSPEERLVALRIETLPDPSLPGGGAGHGGGNFVITQVQASLVPQGEDASSKVRPLALAAAHADYSQNGFEPANVLNADAAKGWAVGGQIDRPHTLTLLLAEPVPLDGYSALAVSLEQLSPHDNHTLGRFRVSLSTDARVADILRAPAKALTLARLSADERSEAQQAELASLYVAEIAPELADVRGRLAAAKKELEELKPTTTVPVMKEMEDAKRRKTHVQFRGNFLDLGPEVSPGVPAAFHPLPEGRPADRLALAHWLVDENNPLTARVIANRYWEAIFGQGLVRTSEEFGSQGELPTHPELLDWLATELVRQRWDLKAFLKLLVTSSTYRQQSHVTAELLARDPDNELLARGPRIRLSAEMIRDQALFVSGLLSPKMYGPPVNPPQPTIGLSAAFGGGIDWKTSEGEDRFRRGLYTTWRRSNPYPSMATFDAPNREVCTVRRDQTNTPLQALVTLNDPVYVEAAQALARRMHAAGGSTAERAQHGFRLCLARPPSEEELAQLTRLYDEAHERFAAQPAQAKQLAGPGGDTPAPDADIAELAAWTVVGNVLLNMDEMFMKR